jgi:FtsZ-binding cell division protein ZapB
MTDDDETVADRSTELEALLGVVRAQIEELKTKNAGLSTVVRDLTISNNLLQGKVTALVADQQDLRAQVGKLTEPDGELALLGEAIKRLELSNEELRRDVDDLKVLGTDVPTLREAVEQVGPATPSSASTSPMPAGGCNRFRRCCSTSRRPGRPRTSSAAGAWSTTSTISSGNAFGSSPRHW